jgi:hypothetical protein
MAREQLRRLDGVNPTTKADKGYARVVRAAGLLVLGTKDDSVKACAILQDESGNTKLTDHNRQLAKSQLDLNCLPHE